MAEPAERGAHATGPDDRNEQGWKQAKKKKVKKKKWKQNMNVIVTYAVRADLVFQRQLDIKLAYHVTG